MSPEQLTTASADLETTAGALRSAAEGGQRVLLTGPVGPDGDSIGACLALAVGLRRLGAAVDVAGTASYRYAWMPGAADMVPDEDVRPGYDLVVVLDGDASRLAPPVDAAFRAAPVQGIIDHHRSTSPDGYDVHLVDGDAASTCDLVYTILTAWGIDLDPVLAQLIYAGLVFDTGGFRHSNTVPATHRLAAELIAQDIDHPAISTRVLLERSRAGLRLLGAVLCDARFLAHGQVVVGVASHPLGTRLGAGPGDLEGIVDHLLYTSGVELACFCIERAPGEVKLSLRSRARVDVAALARSLAPGGGGHARAAGALLHGDLDSVVVRVEAALVAAVGDTGVASPSS